MVTNLDLATIITAWVYIHGWYFGVQSIEWINVLGVLSHSSVIA